MADELSWEVIGPLHGRLIVTAEDGRPRFRRRDQPGKGQKTAAAEANARLILHRTAVAQLHTDSRSGEQEMRDLDDGPVRTWAVETNLGQKHSGDLRRAVLARRASALALLASATNRQAMVVVIEPQAAMITGTGAGGIRNVGIELHGTHGWPVIPASGLKGTAASYARDVTSQDKIRRIFGSPRPGREPAAVPETSADADGERAPAPGSVVFFDALPGPGGVTVAEHDLTPHARDYHTGTDSAGGRLAPAEYVNPVPIPFLVVDGGAFITHLIGPKSDVEEAAELLCAALDDIGVGAKTSAGYGYLTADAEPLAPAVVA